MASTTTTTTAPISRGRGRPKLDLTPEQWMARFRERVRVSNTIRRIASLRRRIAEMQATLDELLATPLPSLPLALRKKEAPLEPLLKK